MILWFWYWALDIVALMLRLGYWILMLLLRRQNDTPTLYIFLWPIRRGNIFQSPELLFWLPSHYNRLSDKTWRNWTRDEGQIEERPSYLLLFILCTRHLAIYVLIMDIEVLNLMKTFIFGYGRTWFISVHIFSGIIFYSFHCEFWKLDR